MNSTSPKTGHQAEVDLRFTCTNCGNVNAEVGCVTVRTKAMGPGRYVLVCHACARRAALSPRLRKQVEIAALAGVPLYEVRRVHALLGADVPTTPEEADRALGLPLGSTAAALG